MLEVKLCVSAVKYFNRYILYVYINNYFINSYNYTFTVQYNMFIILSN